MNIRTARRVPHERMCVALGQAILIENVSGAAGSIGVGRVAHAAPDGYTVGVGHWSTHVVNGAIYDLSYDLLKDFAPVALLPANPQLIVSKKNVPAANLKELIAWLKANESKAAAGNMGRSVGSQNAVIYFQKNTRPRFTLVPHPGTRPAL